jgi:putative addiction module CopG family antidote
VYRHRMSNHGPLPPHLAEFLREQVSSGHFHSEGEVIRTALDMLEGQVHSHGDIAAWLKQEIERGVRSRPSAPATKEFWNGLRQRVQAGGGNAD